MTDRHVKEGQSVGAAIERVATGLAGRIGFAAQEIGGNAVIAFNITGGRVMDPETMYDDIANVGIKDGRDG